MIVMNPQEYFSTLKWGVFTHYLYSSTQNTEYESWNDQIAHLNVEALADAVAETGARYYFITLMQGDNHMLAPNATYDKIVGTKPGEACPNRDLIMELAFALKRRNVDLFLYYTGDGPYKDDISGSKFGFQEPRTNVSMDFVEKWAAVLKEYAVRYGDLVKGWWIDGCYDYFGYNDELLQPYYDAIKAGNPNALVSMNNGGLVGQYFAKEPLKLCKWFRDEEFTTGEHVFFEYVPETKYVDGALSHFLIPLGRNPDGESYGTSATGHPSGWWCSPGLCEDPDVICRYVSDVNAVGGVVTIDIKINYDGSLDPEQVAFLKRLNAET